MSNDNDPALPKETAMPTVTHHTPDTISPPSSAYSHGVQVEGATRWLHVSGQVGLDPSGKLAGDTAAQMETCWWRIFEILGNAGMTKDDIVKVTAYLTNPDEVGLYRDVRDRLMDGHQTASTLIVVAGLAHPDWTVEIEVVAAS